MDEKQASLEALLRSYGSVGVAFSGGTDSAFLLAVAHEVLKDRAFAITAATPFATRAEIQEAEAFCQARGIEWVAVQVDTLAKPAVAQNLPERCYVCKHAIFEAITREATLRKAAFVIDGSNADDAHEHRPGRKALVELGVQSPLCEVGLTKAEVRALSHNLGLPTWSRPSNACLATRFPYGTPLEPKWLAAVAKAEDVLHGLGFDQVRVRAHGELARIEVYPDELERLAKPDTRRLVARHLRELGFTYVCADIEGYRSGSMDGSEQERADV